jgi:uncharacterized membrane protein
MAEDKRIEDYLKALARALSGLPESDRADIVAEIRAHLEHRAGEGKLDEAIKALGAPQHCARSFLDELKLQSAFTDAGPAKTFGALFALASRRTLASAGLFVSGIFYLLALGFGIIAVTEIVAPDSVGLWIDPAHDVFVLGAVDDPGTTTKEILGWWIMPVGAGLSLLALVIGQLLGRLFVGLMIGRK